MLTDSRRLPDEAALERELRTLARAIAYPQTPDLVASVGAALTEPETPDRRRSGWRLFRRSSLVAIAALLALAAGVLAVGFGLRGLSIVFVDSPPQPIGHDLQLGEPTTLAEAQAEAPFRILLPSDIGEPDAVYADDRSGVYRVSLVYRSDNASSADEEVGMLLTQFAARPDIDVAVKQVGPGTSVEHLTVTGQPGFWISGEPHALAYLDEGGRAIEDRVRLVGDVLLWQRGEVTLRLEGAVSMEAALEFAQSTK